MLTSDANGSFLHRKISFSLTINTGSVLVFRPNFSKKKKGTVSLKIVVRKNKHFCPGLALLLYLHLMAASSAASSPEQLATAELMHLEGGCLSHGMLTSKEHAKIQRRLKSKVHRVEWGGPGNQGTTRNHQDSQRTTQLGRWDNLPAWLGGEMKRGDTVVLHGLVRVSLVTGPGLFKGCPGTVLTPC